MLGLLQIHQQGAGAADPQREGVYGKALEALYLQLPLEALHGGVVHKSPFVNGGGVNVPQALPEAFFIASLHHQLLGLEGTYERSNIVQRALRHLELARGDIQEGGAALSLFQSEATEEVVLLGFQHVFPEGNAGGHNLRHAALDQFLGKLGVFQLVADSHFVASPNQFGEIILQGVMGEAGHGYGAFVPVGFLGLNQAQHPHGRNGVVRVHLVKVSYAVQQQRLGVLCFHLEVMLQHRSIFRHFCHRDYKDTIIWGYFHQAGRS